MRSDQDIIQDFMSNGCKPMPNIPGNKIFVTDNTCSTLVWAEGQVVIEHYFLFPDMFTPFHSHPFTNQMIFLSGDLVTFRTNPNSTKVTIVEFDESKHLFHLSDKMPIGQKHSFRVGPRGANIYNIQIWDETPLKIPTSAAIEYSGKSMGPIQEKLKQDFTLLQQ